MATTYLQIKRAGWTYGELKRFSYAYLKKYFDEVKLLNVHSITDERQERHVAGHRYTTSLAPGTEEVSHA